MSSRAGLPYLLEIGEDTVKPALQRKPKKSQNIYTYILLFQPASSLTASTTLGCMKLCYRRSEDPTVDDQGKRGEVH
jgi:hypothetical protein